MISLTALVFKILPTHSLVKDAMTSDSPSTYCYIPFNGERSILVLAEEEGDKSGVDPLQSGVTNFHSL